MRGMRIEHTVVRAANLHAAQRSEVQDGKVREERKVPEPVSHVYGKVHVFRDGSGNRLQERIYAILRLACDIDRFRLAPLAEIILKQWPSIPSRLRSAKRQYAVRAFRFRQQVEQSYGGDRGIGLPVFERVPRFTRVGAEHGKQHVLR